MSWAWRPVPWWCIVTGAVGGDARRDWENRIYQRLTDTSASDPSLALPAPAGVRAHGGAGHVRLDWQPVDGAVGYLIERADVDGGAPVILQHGGSDVAAVPGCSFADTGIDDGVSHRYRIGAVADAASPTWSWSDPTVAAAGDGQPGPVQVRVDASTTTGPVQPVWRMVGSERLSQLDDGVDPHGHHIGTEFAEALRLAHDDLAVTHVRAHAILHDDLQVARRDENGALSFDFGRIDAVYDRLLAIGLRPIVELSFMPAALARDPEQTVFTYRGIISPPRDFAEWHRLIAELTAHLVDRYGIDEVLNWAFEVWNEPNLVVFWAGTPEEYLRLYDEAADAVKGVDRRLRVGGPASSAGEWVHRLAQHAATSDSPMDFVSTHTYGNLPVDLRPALRRHGLPDPPIWWTEWGVGHTHFGPIHDAVLGAPFMLSGYQAVQGRMAALAYWVISDHFEELGRPPRLMHDGFGLLTVGNLRKPRYWAAHLAAHQGEVALDTSLSGDGAEVLVRAWATRHGDGTVDVLLWNGTINAELVGGDPRLDRTVQLTVTGLAAAEYRPSLARVDEQHSNIGRHCPPDIDWPNPALWDALRAHDVLDEQSLPEARSADGVLDFEITLPMPGVARLRLREANRTDVD
jgi:xylan 1,4-beta-xylosidase